MGVSKSKLDGNIPQSTLFCELDLNTKVPSNGNVSLPSDEFNVVQPITDEQWKQNSLAWGLQPWTADRLNFKIDEGLKDYRLVMPTSRQLTICHYCHTPTELTKGQEWFGYKQVYCRSQSCETSARICRQLYLATNNLAQPDLNEIKTPFIDASGHHYFLIAYSFEISSRKPAQIYVKLSYPDQIKRIRFADFLIEQSANFKVIELINRLKPQFDLYYPIEVKHHIEKTYERFMVEHIMAK